nr:ETC complex I subunit [Mesorhizobium sp. BR-1-1-10]
METTGQVDRPTRMTNPQGWPSNDNLHKHLSMGCSLFPDDAVARIYRPSRAVTTSGKARSKGWRLVFERRTAPSIEPLMGYTSGHDALAQVELGFPTLESAIRYAERQGLTYVLQTPTGLVGKGCCLRLDEMPAQAGSSTRASSDAVLDRLGLAVLQESYGRALDSAASRNDPSGSDGWTSPMELACDLTLPLEAKRSILMNWALTEYLIDQATNEGMPENSRPSRLHEVEQALLALEREVAADRDGPGTRATLAVQRQMADRRGDCGLSRLPLSHDSAPRVSADGYALIEAAGAEIGWGSAAVQIQHAERSPVDRQGLVRPW